MKFKLPDELPGTIAELEALLQAAEEEFDSIAAPIKESPEAKISADDLKAMQDLTAAADKLKGAIDEAKAEDDARLEEARQLMEARQARSGVTEEEAPEDEETGEEESAEEEEAPAESEHEEPAEAEHQESEDKEPALAASRKSSFKGLGKSRGKPPAKVAPPTEVGFRMAPTANKYREGLVDYQALAVSLDSMAAGARIRQNRDRPLVREDVDPGKYPVTLATLERGFPAERVVEDVRDLESAVKIATDYEKNYKQPTFRDDGAMAASGGWCAPSETIFTFCAVPALADVISLPDINMTRGGLRWPEEPDFTELYATLPWRFTETQLQNATPPTKPCVEIPCPEMDEIRPEAIGLCITAGILQRRGWPELIAKFMAETMLAHQHKVSAWTIADMVTGSTNVDFLAAGSFAAAGSALNALDLDATNIRLMERLPRTAVVEGVAPVWFPAVLRADLAYNEGRDQKSVTDAEVDSWLAARNIRLQYVADWQTRGAGQPGNATPPVAWPTSVDVLLYPAGAWFRHLSNVIEVGTLYDKAQLQINRYTELFTEDEYFVTKRCKVSHTVTIPLCANGAIGNRVSLLCGTDA